MRLLPFLVLSINLDAFRDLFGAAKAASEPTEPPPDPAEPPGPPADTGLWKGVDLAGPVFPFAGETVAAYHDRGGPYPEDPDGAPLGDDFRWDPWAPSGNQAPGAWIPASAPFHAPLELGTA